MSRTIPNDVLALLLALAFRQPLPDRLDTIDWSMLLTVAGQHRLLPMAFDALRDHPAPPEAVRKKLEAAYYACATRNMHLLQEAERIQTALAGAGIPCLPLKGVAITEPLYGNIALREFEDIDLLIPRESFGDTREVLDGLPYHKPDGLLADAVYLDFHFHIPFVSPPPHATYLEIHWALTDRYLRFTPDLPGMWERANEGRLDPLDELVYLTMHLGKHAVLNGCIARETDLQRIQQRIVDPRSGNRLSWFVDLSLLLARMPIPFPWEALLARARDWGTEAAFCDNLALLRVLGGWPEGVPYALPVRRRRPSLVRSCLYRRLFSKRGAALAERLLDMSEEAQFRPIRLLDLTAYLVGGPDYLRRRYGCPAWSLPFVWPWHLCKASVEILRPAIRAGFGRVWPSRTDRMAGKPNT